MNIDLTIAIPTKNEEFNLPSCLEAIGPFFAKQIVVLDSCSKDGTCSIAKEYGAEVLDFCWNGKFPKKRTWFLREHRPQTQWVLFLDADEYLSEAFKEEVRRTLASTPHNGFWLHYSIYFMGRKLRGGYPLDKLALFRVGSGEYEQIDEERWSDLDMEVHEHPIINGTLGSIRAQIDHRDSRGVDHWIAKHKEYSSWEASRFLRYADNPFIRSKWTVKQKIKYGLMRTPILGIAYFLGSFFLMGGWRDGVRGFSFAKLKMNYFNDISRKIQAGLNKIASNAS